MEDQKLEKLEIMEWLDAVIEAGRQMSRIKKFNERIWVTYPDTGKVVHIYSGIERIAAILGEELVEEYRAELTCPYRYHFLYKDVEIAQVSPEKLT